MLKTSLSRRVSKAVIPAAGLGTRLLSATAEQPKEMLPLFATDSGVLCLKPAVQQIFEQLFDFGLREFCFIVGKGKRAMEDHFTPKRGYVSQLKSQGKSVQAAELERFYEKIQTSTIVWVNQSEPLGFGHAVLQSEAFVRNEAFLVHAGDTYIASKAGPIHSRLFDAHFTNGADTTFTIKEVSDPRQYGVAEVRESDTESHEVIGVEEKPARPKSRFAIMPLYVFMGSIFESLRRTKPDRLGEIQLTDAIQGILDSGGKVEAIILRPDDVRLDIGTPETYWEALEFSYRNATSKLTAR